jgi:hypothetical protein
VLDNGSYTPRAVSRSLDSAGSKALIAKGIEVVVGNLWDKESLKTAIHGSEVVFGVRIYIMESLWRFIHSWSDQNTNFWDPEVFLADPKGTGEITQGKNLVDAAKEVGVKFFIWRSVSAVHQLPILISCQLPTQRDKGVQRALQAYLPCRQSVGSLPYFCRRSSIRSQIRP